MNTFILDLTDLNNIKANEVGNKAANLNILIQNDVNVPTGIVLKSNAYKLFMERNQISKIISNIELNYEDESLLEESSRKIRDKVEKSSIPEEIIDQLRSYSQLFEPNPVAIRSSGLLEDLTKASFAGQYDTFLNIYGLEGVLNHIKKCYASVWNSRALMYRRNNKLSHHDVKIAVIIQKMVNAKVSGVLFTSNPLDINKNEIIIESNFGLGESTVSGITTPDEYILQREKMNKFKIHTKRIGNKLLLTQPKKDMGIEHTFLTENQNRKSSLSENQLYQLAYQGIKIEKIFQNLPQDIEWSIDDENIIHILQSRPITAIDKMSENNQILWSRGYSDDYWNDNTTPLFFELLGTHLTKVVNMELNSIMGYKEIDNQLLKLFKGHVYFNLNVLKKKVEYEIPPFMRNRDVLNYFPNGFGSYGKNKIKKLSFHLKDYLFAQIRIKFYDPDGAMSRTADTYEKWTEKEFKPFCKEFDEKLGDLKEKYDKRSLIKLSEELDEIMIPHFRLVRYGIPIHNIGMNLLTQYLLNRFLGQNLTLEYYPYLISGLKHKLTETNSQIHQLAFLINQSKNLRDIVIKEDSKLIYRKISQSYNQDTKIFLSEFNKFLDNYGDRGFTRDPYYPRWREDPGLIFDVIKSLIFENKIGQSGNFKGRQSKKSAQIEKLVESKIKSERLGFIKWMLFSRILRNSRKYIIFRENQRFNLDSWISRIRMLYLKIGQLLVDVSILTNKRNVFFLFKDEIHSFLTNNYEPIELKEKVKRRIEIFKKYENVLPPKFLIGSKEFDDVQLYDEDCNIYEGIPASYGMITGPIHIINNISQISTVQSGEILIVPRTDPGWTPIFSKIGGLITETGGILSHGAVISREYGIPAVTNIPNATKIFRNNQIVTLNGYNGIIKIKKE
jgi:rifampicin phosphotransferase